MKAGFENTAKLRHVGGKRHRIDLPPYDEVARCVNYDPGSGVFIYKIRPSLRSKNKSGDRADQKSIYGYRRLTIAGVRYQAHIVAWYLMTGSPPLHEIDHINHDRSDNRWCNLREVTALENKRNLSRAKNNRSGVTGVSWSNRYQKWVSQIQVKGKNIYLGRYDVMAFACQARLFAEIRYGFHENHGERT